MPVRPDSVTFPALVRIGELTAQGWSDSAIADELEGYLSHTSRLQMLSDDFCGGWWYLIVWGVKPQGEAASE